MKPIFWKFLTALWIAASLAALLLTVIDKRNAIRRRRRIPEAALFLTALLGGATVEWLTMLVIRHKTRHRRFMLGLPLLMLLHGMLALGLLA